MFPWPKNSDKIMSFSQSHFSGLVCLSFVEVQDFGARKSGYIFKKDIGNGFDENTVVDLNYGVAVLKYLQIQNTCLLPKRSH